MHYSFDHYKLDLRNHNFLEGDIYVYEGTAYPKHISKITYSCNQTINTLYTNHINPKNCRLASLDEIDNFKKSNKKFILI